MTNSPAPFRPYPNRHELVRGQRRFTINLLIAVAAALLALVAHRAVGDPRLVQMYVAAAVIYLVSSLGPAIRWSNTPEFETAEQV